MNEDYNLHLHHSLKEKKLKYVRKGLSGLVNLGNKCYMNSIIQCLSNTLKLTDYFISNSFNKELLENNLNKKNEIQFVLSYSNLMYNIWDSNKLIKPKTFNDNLGKYIAKYSTFQQQDSHECLLYILDLLHNGLSYEIDIEIQGDVKTDTDKLMKQSLESWKKYYEKNFSVISEIFHGVFYNKVMCQNCNFSENIFEPYNSINLDIPKGLSDVSLTDCLNASFSESEEINTWQCEKCKKNGCIKHNKIWNLPNYLIIHLKRFTPTGEKLNTNVSFSLDDINLANWIETSKNDPNNYIYSLYAINYHSGNLNSGHYWSCCKNLDNQWYIFNDGHVSKFHEQSNLINKDAYILFYYRKFINSNNSTSV